MNLITLMIIAYVLLAFNFIFFAIAGFKIARYMRVNNCSFVDSFYNVFTSAI